MNLKFDASEPYAALRLSSRNRKRLAASAATKPNEAAQPAAPVAKAAAPKPSAYAAHAERAARPFVALVQGSAPKPAAAATVAPAKCDAGNWTAAQARAAGKAVPVDPRSDDNHGWGEIWADLNARRGI